MPAVKFRTSRPPVNMLDLAPPSGEGSMHVRTFAAGVSRPAQLADIAVCALAEAQAGRRVYVTTSSSSRDLLQVVGMRHGCRRITYTEHSCLVDAVSGWWEFLGGTIQPSTFVFAVDAAQMSATMADTVRVLRGLTVGACQELVSVFGVDDVGSPVQLRRPARVVMASDRLPCPMSSGGVGRVRGSRFASLWRGASSLSTLHNVVVDDMVERGKVTFRRRSGRAARTVPVVRYPGSPWTVSYRP